MDPDAQTYRKPLRETKVGKWLSRNAPDVLQAAGELTPVGGGALRFIADKIQKRAELTSEALEEWDQIHREAQVEITKRWEADMASDSWLPKNIRPMTLVVLLLTFLVVIVVDSIQWIPFDVSESYVSMLEVLMTTVFTAYFAGRTYEKIRR